MSDYPEEENAIKQSKPFDPIGSLLRHWLKIAVFGSILFVLFFPLAVIKKKVFYKTEGKLLVSPYVQTLITKTEENSLTGYYRDYVKTQSERVKSQENLEKAIEKLSPEIRQIFAPHGQSVSKAATGLANRLEVEYTYGTYFISISLEGGSSKGLAEIINTAMDAYLEQTEVEAEGQETRRLEYLETEKKRIETEISGLTARFKAISKEIGTVDFREAGNIQNNILEGLQEEHVRAYTVRIQKENELKATIREASALQGISIDAEVEDFVLRSSVASEMDIKTYQQIQDLKESLEGLAENNPDRKIIEDQIQNLSDSLDFLKDMLKTQTRQILKSKRDASLQEKILMAQTEYEAAQAAESELKEKIDSVLSEKVAVSNKILDGQQIEKEIENQQSLLSRIEDRINTLRLEARAPGRVSIGSRAISPNTPTGSNFSKLLAYCFIFAFGSVTFFCVLFDFKDPRVRSRKDILDALGANVTWPISNYDLTKTGNIPFSRATLDDSLNVVSKAIHSLVIRLDKERREQNAKLVVFTGIDANSGTTGILVNVAYAMTKLCKRVLVLDANLVNPELDRTLSMESLSPGLVDILVSQENYEKCIFRNEERGIDIMPAGRMLPMSEINLIDRSKISDLLSTLKAQYDFILVDTTPILVSDFTEFFTLQADIAAINVQGDRSRYNALHMTGEILSRLRISAVSVILNWGGPRERNMLQIVVSKLLEPITKRIVTSPKWDVRDVSQETFQEASAGRGLPVLKMVPEILNLFSNKKKILWWFVGILLLGIATYILMGGNSEKDEHPTEKNAPAVIGLKPESKDLAPVNETNASIAPSSPETSERGNSGEGRNPEQQNPGSGPALRDPEPDKTAISEDERQHISGPEDAVDTEDAGPDQPQEDGELLRARENSNEIEIDVLPGPEIKSFTSPEEFILSLPENLYTVQLMGANDRAYLIDVSKAHRISGEAVCFEKKNGSTEWYVLIYKLFSDRSEAMACVENLPSEIKTNSPWIRKIGDIQREISENGI